MTERIPAATPEALKQNLKGLWDDWRHFNKNHTGRMEENMARETWWAHV